MNKFRVNNTHTITVRLIKVNALYFYLVNFVKKNILCAKMLYHKKVCFKTTF